MKMLDKKSLVSQIMLIFLICSILVVTVFTAYITEQDRKQAVRNVQESIQTIALEKANILSLVIGQIQKETEGLAKLAAISIAEEQNQQLTESYKSGPDSTLYRKEKTEGEEQAYSAVFFPAVNQLGPEEIKIINATEKLDFNMEQILERDPYAEWTYIATEEGMLRLLPYSPMDIYDPNHLQKNDPFYLAANPENNPQRKTVWSAPYVDYFGRGWVITCSAPIYLEDSFIGVACVDVCLNTLNDQFLKDFRLGEEGIAYLIQDNGNVIYHPAVVPPESTSGQTFLTNILQATELSMPYRRALEQSIAREDGVISYQNENHKNHMIARAKVVGQPWIVGVEISQSQYLQLNDLGKSSLWHFSLILLLIYMVIAVFLYRQYSKPFDRLIGRAKLISEGNFQYEEPIYNYTEIQKLSEGFNIMSAKMKAYTEDLIQKNREIQSVIDSIGGMLMFLSPHMDMTNMNEKALKALGGNKEQIQGQKCYQVLMGRQEMCKSCAMAETLRTKTTQFARIARGEDILQNLYYPILDAQGQVTQIIVHSHKVTKQVRLEKEMAQQEKMSEVGKLTAAIAHELKNPLAIIKGSSYLASAYAKDHADEDLNESVDTILQATQQAENVIYNLLDFSRPHLQQEAQGNLTKIVDQVILLTKRNTIAKDIQFVTCFEPDPLIYPGNAEPFKSIIMNLVSNAINAIDQGGTILIQGEEREGYLILSVTDNGRGVKEDLRKKLFEAFITADTSGKGNGMGLWITKMMVENLGGTIALDSALGKDTRFTISIPLAMGKGGRT